MDQNDGDQKSSRRPHRASLAARVFFAVLAMLAGYWWLSPDIWSSIMELGEPERARSALRFFDELRPYPARGSNQGAILNWAATLWTERGMHGAYCTVLIANTAVFISAILATFLSPLAASTVSRANAFGETMPLASITLRLVWQLAYWGARVILVVLRAIPEYLMVFFVVALTGLNVWAAVLALAIHNAGVFGRLLSETIENTPQAVPLATRSLGVSRLQVLTFAILPRVFGRIIILLFYRWELCVRDSVVVGMLGVSSLGLWVMDARARDRYDEMLFFLVLSGVLVVFSEAVSLWVRSYFRRS